MPTWPSASKASTTNVDQGSDKISLARADIKQNFDNVNDIIDTFNISSPSDGDLLQYSSSSGQWEQIASTDVAKNYAIFKMAASSDDAGGGLYHWAIDTVNYNAGFLTNNSDSAGGYNFTLETGTYTIEWLGPISAGDAQVDTVQLYNETDSSIEVSFNRIDVGTSDVRSTIFGVFTIASTKEYNFRLVGDPTAVSGDYYFKIEKLA